MEVILHNQPVPDNYRGEIVDELKKKLSPLGKLEQRTTTMEGTIEIGEATGEIKETADDHLLHGNRSAPGLAHSLGLKGLVINNVKDDVL